MGIWVEQRFCSGRFHATRWRQNPFEDPYGEWPPSPWRLLRALAGRWFQYARETGDADEQKRDRLLQSLASSVPDYRLPDLAWRGPAIKQYQPLEVGWSDPAAKASAVREPSTTLAADTYWCVGPEDPILWSWPLLDLAAGDLRLLHELMRRILYFGRAESQCRLRVLESPPADLEINCRLQETDTGGGAPVLVQKPGSILDLSVLLSPTDGALLRNTAAPPGATWYYAQIPRPRAKIRASHSGRIESSYVVQFAVGGRVFPALRDWVRLTEAVRRSALAGFMRASNDALRLALFAGKDQNGVPLTRHEHPYFVLWPDEDGLPTRLIVWRRPEPFEEPEIRSLWETARRSFGWGVEGWSAQIMPLPAETPVPAALGFDRAAAVWESVTPFVSPAQRRRFRKNGKSRTGETPERILRKLLAASGMPLPEVELISGREPVWVLLHQTRERRLLFEQTRTPLVRPGYYVRIRFPEPVRGPITAGDSCHFGLGLFRVAG